MTAHQQKLEIQATRPVRTVIYGKEIQELANDPRLDVCTYESLQDLLQEIPTAMEPELIIILQGFSDQFCPTQIDQLFNKYPLSRLLCVYDPICESDGRTRCLWPQSVRIPQWRLGQRLEQEIAVLTGNASAIPATATREETIRFEFQPLPAPHQLTNPSRQMVVFSPDATWTELIADSWNSISQSKCHQIHTLRSLGDFLQAEIAFNGEIIMDIDPFNQAIKSWLQDRQQAPPRDHTDNHAVQGSSSPQRPSDDILKFSPAPETSVRSLNEQILAVSNWLIPHRRQELAQFGVRRYVCKLNLPEILSSLSKKHFAKRFTR